MATEMLQNWYLLSARSYVYVCNNNKAAPGCWLCITMHAYFTDEETEAHRGEVIESVSVGTGTEVRSQ